MAQLTADKSRKFKLDPHVNTEQPVDAATQIFMGSMVSRNASTNLARQLVGGEDFLGFANGPAYNILDPNRPGLTNNGILVGNASAINVEVRAEGVLSVPLASVAGAAGAANIEAGVFASDGDTLQLAAFTTTLTETGSPTGGTFVLGPGGASGANGSAIAQAALPAAVVTGLPANVAPLVSGITGPAGGPWVIAWNPGVTPPVLTIATNSLSGGSSPNVTVGSATAATNISKIGTIRNYISGQFEILFKALTEKVS